MTTYVSPSMIDFDLDFDAGFRNKIINGDMRVSQRGYSWPSITSNTYTIDRWEFQQSSETHVLSAAQSVNVPDNAGLLNSLKMTTVTAGTASYSALAYNMEGYDVAPLLGNYCTLSFWVRTDKTGTYSVSLRDSSASYHYVAEYAVAAADTWEYKTITIFINDTLPTWEVGSARSLQIWFVLSGTGYQTSTLDSWETGNLVMSSNQVNAFDTAGNEFRLTGVQLEVGAQATPFEHRPLPTELDMCQRYYQNRTSSDPGAQDIFCGDIQTAYDYLKYVAFPVVMRDTPTVVATLQSDSGFNAATFAASGTPNRKGFRVLCTADTTTPRGFFRYTWTADAEL